MTTRLHTIPYSTKVHLLLLIATLAITPPTLALGQNMEVHNTAGVHMAIEMADMDPVLRVTIPDGPQDQRTFDILFPEHITARPHNTHQDDRLYLFKPGPQRSAPHWQGKGQTLQYSSDFGQIHFTASATLVPDGILFRYDFRNDSPTDYDSIYAVTDPRFSSVFNDQRLERTYVHHQDGFALLAADTPDRLTMPLSQWFPVRYHAQYTSPIPENRVQHRSDGITYIYNKRPVDLPMIATLSSDGTWIASSFSRNPGNVWSNPQLTCQHVDPQVSLPHGNRASYEVKLLLFPGSLEQALEKVRAQLPTLRD